MPSLPAAVAGRAERMFGHPLKVHVLQEVSPGLVRLVLRGDAVTRRRMRAGGEVEFRVNDRDFRHFTVAGSDLRRGTVEVLLSTARPPGPALTWLRGLNVGADVLMMGPGHPVRVSGPTAVLGDLTAVGFARGLLELARAGTSVLHGAVEVPAADLRAVADLLPGVDVCPPPSPGRRSPTGWTAAQEPGSGSSWVAPT